jgi:hypothetical protein
VGHFALASKEFLERKFGDFVVGAVFDLGDLFGQDVLGVPFGLSSPNPFPFSVDGDDRIENSTFSLDASSHSISV